MITELFTLTKLFIVLGLAGFAGCFLSIIFSFFHEKKVIPKIESISTFLLGTSFTGVLLGKLFSHIYLLNITLSVSCGIVCCFLSTHFLQVSLKKTFENEIGV
jgi:membrane-bound ClpP family serine protease